MHLGSSFSTGTSGKSPEGVVEGSSGRCHPLTNPRESPLDMFLPQYKRENGLRMGPVLGREALPLTAHPRPGREAAFFPS